MKRPWAGRKVHALGSNPLLHAAEPVFALLHEWLQRTATDAGSGADSATDLGAAIATALSDYPDEAMRLGADTQSARAASLVLTEQARDAGVDLPLAAAEHRSGQPLLSSSPSVELLQFFACVSDRGVAGSIDGLPSSATQTSAGSLPLSAVRTSPATSNRRAPRAPLWASAAIVAATLLALHEALEFAIEARVEPLFVQLQYIGRPQEASSGQRCGAGLACWGGEVGRAALHTESGFNSPRTISHAGY